MCSMSLLSHRHGMLVEGLNRFLVVWSWRLAANGSADHCTLACEVLGYNELRGYTLPKHSEADTIHHLCES